MKAFITIFLVGLNLFLFGQDELSVHFSPEGGVYASETEVVLSADKGATIYYTLDGSIPSSSSYRYQKAVLVKEVAVIRAVVYKQGKRSKVMTNTYVCDRKYDLPVVSIATPAGNLWDVEYGMYVKGCCADTIEPYLGANYWKDWEREANIEMYDEKGQLCFNKNVGINIFGGYSRILAMKSIAVFARKRYGDNRFKYPIFPARDNDKYKSFILRNSGGDFLRTHLRDAFMTQLAKPTGLAIQEYRPAVLFINGEYWGIQNIREKINEHYLKENYDVDKKNVDILRQNGVRRHGYSANYKKLLAYLRNHDLSKDENLEELRTFMDVDDFVRYNIAEVYSDNRDAGGNIRYWRERNDSAKWRWVFYDLDQGLGNNAPDGYKRNTLKKFTSVNNEQWPDPPWSTFIIRKLLENKELETQYINTFADHLNTFYHPDTANRLLDKLIKGIDSEMVYHQKRWGSSYENWQHHLDILRTFINRRPYYCRQHLMEKFNLADTAMVTVIHPGTDKCKIQFNSLRLKKDFKGVYFTAVPINIEVKLKHDYKLEGWKDDPTAGTKRTIDLSESITLEPIIVPKEKSKWSDSVIFNELAFYQPEPDTSGDWVELYNRSQTTIDISGWKITEREFSNAWSVPEGTTLKAGELLLLTENLNRFRTTYSSDSIHAIGDFLMGFSSEGERVKMYDREGFMVDSLSYHTFCQNENPDSLFTISRVHPDSLSGIKHWKRETPTPSGHSNAYLQFLQQEADKKYWTKMFYLGGGSFFFILVVGILSFRHFKNKRQKR
ncbi:MAG: CotH kinase family protein [Crocinitomicaceae bacterium]